MSLPSYIPRSDNFGNWYFGGFQVDSIVEVGYGAATALNQTQAEWEAFLTAALGSNWAKTGTGTSTNYYFRFAANGWEPLSGAVSSTENYRFSWVSSSFLLNTVATGTPVTISQSNGSLLKTNLFGGTSYSAFAVANAQGIWIATAAKSTFGTLGNTISSYLGWVNNPVFPTNTNDRVRNCVIGGAQSSGFLCSRTPDSTVPGAVSVNNVIGCEIPTTGANITDLTFIDTNTNNLAIGTAPNALVFPGSLTTGQLYRIPPAIDPSGNTEQNIWLCTSVVNFAFNGSTSAGANSSRLIRVWSNNIT